MWEGFSDIAPDRPSKLPAGHLVLTSECPSHPRPLSMVSWPPGHYALGQGLLPRWYLATPADSLVVTTWGRGTTGSLWVEAKDAASHPPSRGQLPITKNSLAPKVNVADIGKPCSKPLLLKVWSADPHSRCAWELARMMGPQAPSPTYGGRICTLGRCPEDKCVLYEFSSAPRTPYEGHSWLLWGSWSTGWINSLVLELMSLTGTLLIKQSTWPSLSLRVCIQNTQRNVGVDTEGRRKKEEVLFLC